MKRLQACALLIVSIAFSMLHAASPSPAVNTDPSGQASQAEKPASGPFGFSYGMTKQQIIALVGQNAVRHNEGDILDLTTAPKPHPAFDSYVVMVSPETGLIKIMVFTPHIATNDSGDQLREKYLELQSALQTRYGKPAGDYNFLKSGSIWTESNYWMMSLLKGDRSLASAWEFDGTQNDHLKLVFLEASADRTNRGSVSIAYEFAGFSEYQRKKKALHDQVL